LATRRPLIQRISPLARRIPLDLGVDDVGVVDALKRRAPGALELRADELARDQYDDLCDAVEPEIRGRGGSAGGERS
jgi:hypothetical protein